MQIENAQHQNNYNTYEILIKVIGVFEIACSRRRIKLNKTRATEWRSHFNINLRKRKEEKLKAIKLVKDMYDIDTNDDVAEAILIGKYRSDQRSKEKMEDLF